jgi:hypothetical protein
VSAARNRFARIDCRATMMISRNSIKGTGRREFGPLR